MKYIAGSLLVLTMLVFGTGCNQPPPVAPMASVPVAVDVPRLYPDGAVEAVFIRGTRWNIVVGGHDEALGMASAYGLTNCTKQDIFLQSGLTYENQRDTILHEILHAGTCDTNGNLHNTYYNSESELSHDGIYKIADFITEVLHTNPELAKYLTN